MQLVPYQQPCRYRLSSHTVPSTGIWCCVQAVRYLTELGSQEVGVAGGVVDIAPGYLILSEAAIRELSHSILICSEVSLPQSWGVSQRRSSTSHKCSGWCCRLPPPLPPSWPHCIATWDSWLQPRASYQRHEDTLLKMYVSMPWSDHESD